MAEEKVVLKTNEGFTKIESIQRGELEKELNILLARTKDVDTATYKRIKFVDTGDRNANGLRVFEQDYDEVKS